MVYKNPVKQADKVFLTGLKFYSSKGISEPSV